MPIYQIVLLIIIFIAIVGASIVEMRSKSRRKQARLATEKMLMEFGLEHDGVSIRLEDIIVRVSRKRFDAGLAFRAKLPPPLDKLSMSDSGARELWERVKTVQSPAAVAMPTTEDNGFNGVFDFASAPPPEVIAALNNPEIREIFTECRETFDGLWVDRHRGYRRLTRDDQAQRRNPFERYPATPTRPRLRYTSRRK